MTQPDQASSPFAGESGPSLVLATGRGEVQRLLETAGVPVTETARSIFDDTGERASLWASRCTAEQAADIIAAREAADVGGRSACRLSLGVERILETAEGTWPALPSNRVQARELLMVLRGKTHRVITAVVLVQDGAPVWQAVDVGYVEMRDFDTAFLDDYLDVMGDSVRGLMGGYRLDGLGVQLVSRVFGTSYSLLGFPLVRLLEELRARGVLAS
jgi:septum formation protein